MAEAPAKVPVKTEKKPAEAPSALEAWQPFDNLRREVDRLFEDFGRGYWPSPFRRSVFDLEPLWQRQWRWGAAVPAVDIVEKNKAYEVTAELPGLDDKDIEVKLVDDGLTIKGKKEEEKEEKEKGYYLRERHFGSFERSFRLPEGVDRDKIEATFKKGVLTVTLPKTAAAQKPKKTIKVKAA